MAKEISKNTTTIKVLAPNSASKEITSSQQSLGLGIEVDAEVNGIGMGVRRNVRHTTITPTSTNS